VVPSHLNLNLILSRFVPETTGRNHSTLVKLSCKAGQTLYISTKSGELLVKFE